MYGPLPVDRRHQPERRRPVDNGPPGPATESTRLSLASDDDAASLVDQVKWAVLLPYERMPPEMRLFWRRLAQAMRHLR